MSRLLRSAFLLGALGFAALAPACKEDPTEDGILPAKDFEPLGEDIPFDRNVIVDADAFKDSTSLTVENVTRFLHRTPYLRPSFLETYQSNGVPAAEAIMRASRNYKLNPLVFLAFAEAKQGLVGAREYPFPPERVEYVFECGCLRKGACEPALAGFDRQLDCLGRQLRDALDAIAKNGTTPAGWGPEKTSTTLDNEKVTPVNDATAVVYDRFPRVNLGKAGGAWLIWNLWNVYAVGIEYGGPVGPSSGRWIGDPCSDTAQCGYMNAICSTTQKGGLCTASCTDTCPTPEPGRTEAFCADFGKDGGFCLPICNLGAPDCRDGYQCKSVKRFGSSAEQSPVCIPTGL